MRHMRSKAIRASCSPNLPKITSPYQFNASCWWCSAFWLHSLGSTSRRTLLLYLLRDWSWKCWDQRSYICIYMTGVQVTWNQYGATSKLIFRFFCEKVSFISLYIIIVSDVLALDIGSCASAYCMYTLDPSMRMMVFIWSWPGYVVDSILHLRDVYLFKPGQSNNSEKHHLHYPDHHSLQHHPIAEGYTPISREYIH